MTEQVKIMRRQVKDNIVAMIQRNQLQEAQIILDRYLQMVQNDPEAFSMQAVLFIQSQQWEEARAALETGLKIDSYDFDLQYNLAYLKELQQEYREAGVIYSRLSKGPYLLEQQKIALTSLENLKLQHPESVDASSLGKIAFLVKAGMDAFLPEVMDALSKEWEIQKVIVTDMSQVEQAMEWADICWFEWCDELVAYGSRLPMSKDKKILCRLHSYEAFSDYIQQVAWEAIDQIIFVAEHIRKYVLDNVAALREEQTIVIPNGINMNQYQFREHKPGFNIAYVGYINYKKGPMLLLHTFKAIHDADSRYKLYIAGTFQDGRDVLYFQQMITEMNLGGSIIYTGWQDNLDAWLEDKNYILCTSVLESQNISVMQAMAKGIKPLVHHFVGAKEIYSPQYVWNTIDQCVAMVTEKTYHSREYHEFIAGHYSIHQQKESIGKLVSAIANDQPVNRNNTPVVEENFDYAAYWNNRLNVKFDIEGVGYIGLGKVYNTQLYELRINILDYLIKKIFSSGLKHKKVLELGPGIGVFTQYFHSLKVKYEAIDITVKSVTELKKRYKNYRFTQGDICNPLLYREHTYDLIFAADVLLHLTDEEKYQQAIKNISQGLTNQGYAILYDPITLIDTKSQSPHVRIRDLQYIKKVCSENGLEIAGVIPCSFFMNYPFDQELSDSGAQVDAIFTLIQEIFGTDELEKRDKESLVRWLAAIEKKCLVECGFGFSQKAIVLKKVGNGFGSTFSIKEVWNSNTILKEQGKLQESILPILKRNQCVAQLGNLLDALEKNIQSSALKNVQVNVLEQPLVTVGILNYNGEKYLRTCLESYLHQTYKNIEILVIDDCSSDGSLEIIREYEKQYPHVKGVYHSQNSGGAARGIQDVFDMAAGKYFQWISYDDYVEPDAIERFVEFLERHPDMDYVFSNYNIVNDGNCKINQWQYEVVTGQQAIARIFKVISGLIPMNGLYKTKFFKEKGISWLLYKDNDYSSDTLNYLQFLKYDWRYGKTEKALINYRIHDSNLSHNMKRRIISSKTILDFIIENFNESVYWPEIDWEKTPNRELVKNYVLAQIYYAQAVNHMNIQKQPSYLQSTHNYDNKEACFAFISEGFTYLKAALAVESAYTTQLHSLLEEYYILYPQLKEKV